MLVELVVLLVLSEFLDYVLDLLALLALTLRQLSKSQSFVLAPRLPFSSGGHLRLNDKLFCQGLAGHPDLSFLPNVINFPLKSITPGSVRSFNKWKSSTKALIDIVPNLVGDEKWVILVGLTIAVAVVLGGKGDWLMLSVLVGVKWLIFFLEDGEGVFLHLFLTFLIIYIWYPTWGGIFKIILP